MSHAQPPSWAFLLSSWSCSSRRLTLSADGGDDRSLSGVASPPDIKSPQALKSGILPGVSFQPREGQRCLSAYSNSPTASVGTSMQSLRFWLAFSSCSHSFASAVVAHPRALSSRLHRIRTRPPAQETPEVHRIHSRISRTRPDGDSSGKDHPILSTAHRHRVTEFLFLWRRESVLPQ
jgi:hypothetical protein